MSMAAKKLGILHFKKRGLWRQNVLLEKGGAPNGKDPFFILFFFWNLIICVIIIQRRGYEFEIQLIYIDIILELQS